MITLSLVHRRAPSTTHRRTGYAAATAGLVGTLLAVTLGSASAMPGRDDHPTLPAGTAHADGHPHGHYVGHGCFITPHTWSDALAGPMPVCYTRVP